jgi:hypothetical protein
MLGHASFGLEIQLYHVFLLDGHFMQLNALAFCPISLMFLLLKNV